MGRHIVGAFIGMTIGRIAVGNEAEEEAFKVAPDLRLGIFADDQRRACMVNENCANPSTHPRGSHHFLDSRSDFVGASTGRLQRDGFGVEHCEELAAIKFLRKF